MKRYQLFAGDVYYPRGGAADYCGDADTLEEAQAWGAEHGESDDTWWNVLDAETGAVAASCSESEITPR